MTSSSGWRTIAGRARRALNPAPTSEKLTPAKESAAPQAGSAPRKQKATTPKLSDPLSLLLTRTYRRAVIVAGRGSAEPVLDVIALLRPKASSVIVLAPVEDPAWLLDRHEIQYERATTVAEVNWFLKQRGPVDAIVDVSDDEGLTQAVTWKTCFLHLRDRGVYVAVGHPGASSSQSLRSAASAVLADRPGTGAASAVDLLLVSDGGIAMTKRGNHYLNLRDLESARFLPSRDVPAAVSVLEQRPAGKLEPRCSVRHHGLDSAPARFPQVMEFPRLTIRHYSGRIALASHSVLYTEGTVLPETYRYPLARKLGHDYLAAVTEQFVTVPKRYRPERELSGTYFHLDSPYPGHFGHVSTEVVSRLWGWAEAKRRFPDLKAIWRVKYPNERDPEFERLLFGAFGIAAEDLVWVSEPVWLESVVGVTPMWQNQEPFYVHPDLTKTWDRIRDGLAVARPDSPTKIFVSRQPGLARQCRNLDAVENVFRRFGFTVIFPEKLPLGEQATLFRNARVVAGLAGSAMFNVQFCEQLENYIVLTHEAYTARNEYLFATLLGGQLDYFWSVPDIAHPDGGWTQEAFTSGWEFDFGRNGEPLEALLGSLA